MLLHGVALERLGHRGCSLAGIEVNGQYIIALGALADADSADAAFSQKELGKLVFGVPEFFVDVHAHRIHQTQASVTLNAASTSWMWLAMVCVLDPANSRPTARLVCRSRMSEPESPAALKEPGSPWMMI
jgi:hypothetical protein